MTPPSSGILKLHSKISGSITAKTTSQQISLTEMNFTDLKNSTFIQILNSPLASFAANAVIYLDFNNIDSGANERRQLPPDTYSLQLMEYEFEDHYDPNVISKQALDMIIGSEVSLDVPETPNMIALTITENILETFNIDTRKPLTIEHLCQLNVPNQANEFDQFHNYLYTYSSLSTNFSSISEAYENDGQLLREHCDAFYMRDGWVFLDIGTQKEISLLSDNDETDIEYIITALDGHPVANISDYSADYRLQLSQKIDAASNVTIPAGTDVRIELPNALIPHVYLPDRPYVTIPVFQADTRVKVPIKNCYIKGSQLIFSTPFEIQLEQSTIYIPIQFLAASADLAVSLSGLSFSGKPVPASTKVFTLEGSRQDTVQLTTTSKVYEQGQPASYMAVINDSASNKNYDQYVALTVPTNKYNAAETSDNVFSASIKNLRPVNENTVVYFQTAEKATTMDISVLKYANHPSLQNLENYYNTVIRENWVLFKEGQQLSDNVVMAVAYTPAPYGYSLPLRIDYQVQIDSTADSLSQFNNDAVFYYFSSRTGQAIQSNLVSIHNLLPAPIPLIQSPAQQTISAVGGASAIFNHTFVMPTNLSADQEVYLECKLNSILTPDPNRSQVMLYPDVHLDMVMDIEPETNFVRIHFDPLSMSLGECITVVLATTITETIENTAQLEVKNVAALIVDQEPRSISSEAEILLSPVLPKPAPEPEPEVKPEPALEPKQRAVPVTAPDTVPMLLFPLSQTCLMESGAVLGFSIAIDGSPAKEIKTLTVESSLHPCLSLDMSRISVMNSIGLDVPFMIENSSSDHVFDISFLPSSNTAETRIIKLEANLKDSEQIPANKKAENKVSLVFNQDQKTRSISNPVTVCFEKSCYALKQAIVDLIESVALEQAAIAHILNAQGEVLQAVIHMPEVDCPMLIKINQSVKRTIDVILRLEMILESKLAFTRELFLLPDIFKNK